MLDPFPRSCGPRERKSCRAHPKRYVLELKANETSLSISRENNFQLTESTLQTSANGNITTSDIVYLPTPEDNGKVIACSVPVEEKNNAPTLSIKDTRILDIKRKCRIASAFRNQLCSDSLGFTHFPIIHSRPTDAPIVTLSLGSNLDPKNLAKGTDVYLECRIEANPPIKKIEWYHNNKPLHSSRGIIITNQSLVLQSISKQTHGQYMCRAANTQGSVSSNDLYLDIKCKLTSKSGRVATHSSKANYNC